MTNLDQIIINISQSKKYKSLYKPTISRIVNEIAKRYPEKLIEFETKKKLHQIWGAYYTTRPDFRKLLTKTEQLFLEGKNPKEILLPLLQIHNSTKERIPILEDFYKNIFAITGNPQSVIDYACGLNPLSFPWMLLTDTANYTAFDIDTEEVSFINDIFKLFHIEKTSKALVGDITEIETHYADVIFILKVLPLLEQQQKGLSSNLLQKLNCKFLVVSFPTKALSGTNKGMQYFYESQFEKQASEINLKFVKINFNSEVVYILNKI
jgi:16S rRNA (guanine(1405)-N(7))-methyltransferase